MGSFDYPTTLADGAGLSVLPAGADPRGAPRAQSPIAGETPGRWCSPLGGPRRLGIASPARAVRPLVPLEQSARAADGAPSRGSSPVRQWHERCSRPLESLEQPSVLLQRLSARSWGCLLNLEVVSSGLDLTSRGLSRGVPPPLLLRTVAGLFPAGDGQRPALYPVRSFNHLGT